MPVTDAATGDGGHATHAHAHGGTAALALGALGIVYGDIGTSPLYAFREAIEHHHLEVVEPIVLGAARWRSGRSSSSSRSSTSRSSCGPTTAARADPGAAVARRPATGTLDGRIAALVLLGVFGTALLYGDGMITPAISVLSAVEGFEVASPALERWVIPASIVILIGLFAVQRKAPAASGECSAP